MSSLGSNPLLELRQTHELAEQANSVRTTPIAGYDCPRICAATLRSLAPRSFSRKVMKSRKGSFRNKTDVNFNLANVGAGELGRGAYALYVCYSGLPDGA